MIQAKINCDALMFKDNKQWIEIGYYYKHLDGNETKYYLHGSY